MRSHRLNILLVEDDPGDAGLVRFALSSSRQPCKLALATCLSEALAAKRDDQDFDAILLDLSLPDSFGFPTVAAVRAHYPACPIVVLTGLEDPMLEDETVRSGAQDYLIKGSFDDEGLMRAIRHAIVRQSLERRLVASETEHRTLVNLAPDAIMVADLDGVVISANQAAAKMFATDDVVGVAVHTLLPDAPPLLSAAMDGGDQRGDGTGKRDADFPVSMAVAPLGDGRAVIMVRDITERTRLTNELQMLACTDPLTKLSNRRVFVESAQAEFQRCKRFGTAASILMIDIDHFKRVNDRYGHQAGDDALVAMAGVLLDVERTTDLPARFGGEEFVVLLPGTDLAGALLTAERIRQAAAALVVPSPMGNLSFTVSIGVTALAPEHDDDWNDGLHRADKGLYQAKAGGRDRVVGIGPSAEVPTLHPKTATG
ncbi:MAG: diguanylate cyclase [Rhodospirillaceae bacterium]|nr:diguanylate cyclase [Rhodospirillales bacterium]